MQCIFVNNLFQAESFRKLDGFKREQYKKLGIPVSGSLFFKNTMGVINDTFESFQLHNRVLSHRESLFSKDNIETEFKGSFGIWEEFVDAMISSAKEQALKFNYDNYQLKDGFIAFTLNEDSRILDESINRETMLIIESKTNKDKTDTIKVGTFEGYSDDGGIMLIKPTAKLKRNQTLPKKGQFCVDYNQEIRQYQRQKEAMNDFSHDDVYITNLKGILAGVQSPTLVPQLKRLKFFDQNLDPSQERAVDKIFSANEIAVVQGPPGTGKTNVLLEVVRQILYRNKRNPLSRDRILIVSQSHAAVDKIIEDLDPYADGATLIRIGRDDDLSELSREKYSLDNRREVWIQEIKNKSSSAQIKLLNYHGIDESDFIKYAEAVEVLTISGISSSDADASNAIVNAFNEKYPKKRDSKMLMILLTQHRWIRCISETNDMDEHFINAATVVAGTCSGFVSNPYVKNVLFEYVIVDEAAKATFPELMVPIVRAKKVILVGDHKQLPPVFDRKALSQSEQKIEVDQLKKCGFEKVFDLIDDSCRQVLETQYRMHPCIGNMINSIFYSELALTNGVTPDERTLNIPFLSGTAMLWVSTSTLPLDERSEESLINSNGDVSYANPLEVDIVMAYLRKLDNEIENDQYTIGVITPYRAQLLLLQRQIKSSEYKEIFVEANTVDAFQGSQKDIILYSTVRSSTVANIGFLNEQSRLNVSFSRAKSCLIIIGDADFLDDTSIRNNKFPAIISYMRDNAQFCKIINHRGKYR
jgi:superfamily I DNA and/or RNA helicase